MPRGTRACWFGKPQSAWLSSGAERLSPVPLSCCHVLKPLICRGKLIRSLKGHGHWVNALALSSEYALRTGAYDHTGSAPAGAEAGMAAARKRWVDATGGKPERLVSGALPL